jgi:integrase
MPYMPDPDLQEKVANVEKEIERLPPDLKKDFTTFKSYCASYSPRTYRNNLGYVLGFLRFLKNQTNYDEKNNNPDLKTLLTTDAPTKLIEYKQYLDGKTFDTTDRPNKGSASRNMIRALKLFYYAAYRTTIVPYGTTTRKFFGFTDAYRGDIDLITDNEFKRLVENAPNKLWKAIIYTLGTSGLRVGELCNLQLNDLFYDENRIRVEFGKRGVARNTLFSPKCQELVKEYLAEREVLKSPGDCVFWKDVLGKKRLTPRFVYLGLLDIGKQAFVQRKLYPHLLRHFFTTRLIKKVPLKVVQRWLGHKSMETTGGYIDLSERVEGDYFSNSPLD